MKHSETCPLCHSPKQKIDIHPVEWTDSSQVKHTIPVVEFTLCEDCGECWQTSDQFKAYQHQYTRYYEELKPKIPEEIKPIVDFVETLSVVSKRVTKE